MEVVLACFYYGKWQQGLSTLFHQRISIRHVLQPLSGLKIH